MATHPTDRATPDPAAAAAPDAGLSAAEAQAGVDAATLLGGEPDDTAPDAAAGARPAPPEFYQLDAPDGMPIDAQALALATPVFRDLGLSNMQAQSLVPVAAEWARSIRTQGDQQLLAAVATQRKEWFDAAKSDAEIGGAQWSQSLGIAAKGLDLMGFPKGSPFRTLLDDSGLGNHPEMIRAWARIGKLVSEDGFDRPGTPSSAGPRSDAELFYPDVKGR